MRVLRPRVSVLAPELADLGLDLVLIRYEDAALAAEELSREQRQWPLLSSEHCEELLSLVQEAAH